MVENPAEVTRKILAKVLDEEARRAINVRLWDGTYWPDDRPRRATLALNHPGALRQMFLPGDEVSLAEAYLYNDFDIEGDIEAVFPLADSIAEKVKDTKWKLRLGTELLKLPNQKMERVGRRGRARLRGRRHSIERDRQAIAYHYDVSNEFYALWLDERMVYSCAYFTSPDDDLDTAQEQKLDYICRKLRLRPGQRLLDIGCGWGALVLHAARHYGVDALGITLSHNQLEWANERIAEAGLAEHCRVEALDYREVDEPEGFDRLVSVGMFEHVGEEMLEVYFRRAYRLLKPGGLFLNHAIARRATDPKRKGATFSNTYVFPDGELIPIGDTLRVAEKVGFEVRDVESLREHYALTLRHWVRRLEAHHEEALQYVDEPTYRVWRLFMSGSAYGFTIGRHNVYQSLLLKPGPHGESGLPLTRADLYSTT